MITATLDLFGIYNYDNTVLDKLKVPEGVDADTVKDNLLLDTAELELLYSDSDFLRTAIGVWSTKQIPVWTELLKTTQYIYNPIWNKDGTVIETETRNLLQEELVNDANEHNTKTQHSGESGNNRTANTATNYTQNLEDKETKALENTSNVVTTENVYGFNSNTDAPAKKTTVNGTSKDTGTDTNNHTGTSSENQIGTIIDTGSDSYTDEITGGDTRTINKNASDTGTITHERKEQGNIGVTSTQALIMEQREVVKLNIIDIIINDFIDRFCLKVY